MQGGWQEDSEAQHPKTDAHQAAQHHSLSSVTAEEIKDKMLKFKTYR